MELDAVPGCYSPLPVSPRIFQYVIAYAIDRIGAFIAYTEDGIRPGNCIGHILRSDKPNRGGIAEDGVGTGSCIDRCLGLGGRPGAGANTQQQKYR